MPFCLERPRGLVSETLVHAHQVVVADNVLEYRAAHFLARGECRSVYEFLFQRSKVTLAHRVVVAVAPEPVKNVRTVSCGV